MRALRSTLLAMGLVFLFEATPALACPANYISGAIRTSGGAWPASITAVVYLNGQQLYSGDGQGCGFSYDPTYGAYGINFLQSLPGQYDISVFSELGTGYTACFYDGIHPAVCNIRLCEYCG